MDQNQQDEPQMSPDVNVSADQINESSSPFEENLDQGGENKAPRRPGRPPLRIKNRMKRQSRNSQQDNQNDEDFEAQRPKTREKNLFFKQQKENNLEGFLKIIDYLKKIQCDQASLHNKMNPYNLLTPTCFWYMVSAEYFSFDFFANKNHQELALQFLKRAQKTQIILPLRFIKPQKSQVSLDFQTQELKSFSSPVAQKLTSLTSMISSPQVVIQNIEKSNFLSSVAEDNSFRCSTRAIVFNWIKRKIGSSEKWSNSIKPKLDMGNRTLSKQFTSRIYEFQDEIKHEQLNVAPEMLGRQPRNKKPVVEPKKNKIVKKPTVHAKKAKKQDVDEIYDESESSQVKKQQIAAKIEEQEQVCNKDEKQEKEEQLDEDVKLEGNYVTDLGGDNKNEKMKCEQIDESDEDEDQDRVKSYELVTTTKYYGEDDVLLDAILHMPIDNIISILKASIEAPRLPVITRPFMPIPKSDPLELVNQIHSSQQVFLNYMKQKQEKMYIEKSCHSESVIEEKEREGQVEDAKCQVCTDGDYTEDNLIVFCSMCNISLHQRCVGLAKVPADNWICQVCASFGPAGINVPCPLCHVRGGALKRTLIHINTPLFKDTNPQFHEFAKKCPNYKHKEEYIHPRSGKDDQPYYDYFSKSTYPTDQPVCHFVWVHYVCAIWIPQCYFEQKNGLINIKGIQNIDKKRFKQKCLVCRETRSGACVKCDNQNCVKYYHPECARKKRIYMEQLNLDRLKYLIFCEAHEPLKVKRKIQVKKKKQRDQIVKFCRGIEKYVETYKIANLPFKLLRLGTGSATQLSKIDPKNSKNQIVDQRIASRSEKNSDEDFIKSVVDGLCKQNQIIVNLSYLGNERYKVNEIVKPSKRDMKKSLTRQQEFWKKFKNTETPQANLKRFNTIMRQNHFLKEKVENFINYGSNAEDTPNKDDRKLVKRGVSRRKRQKIETVIEEQGALFCVCRRPYNGENDMFECEVCNEWYHHDCIGFVGSQEDAQKLDFHCMKCLKYQPPQIRRQLLEKCSKYFSEDSLFLNYRPPTPSLQSQQEEVEQSLNKKEMDKKDHSEFKNFVVEIENMGRGPSISKSLNSPGNEQRSIYIPDQKINLQAPFVILDSRMQNEDEGRQLSKELEEMNEQQSPNFGKEKQNHNIVQEQSAKNANNGINKVEVVQQQPISKLASQSPLRTPQFRPAVFSFCQQMNEKQNNSVKSLHQLQSRKLAQMEDAEMREQNQNSDQNQNEKSYEQFHFNREQIVKLRYSIQQEQERQIKFSQQGQANQP